MSSPWLARTNLAKQSAPSNPLAPSQKFNQQAEQPMQIDGLAPTFQKKPSIQHEQEGKRLLFECLVEAEPEPSVQWFHNGQQLAPSARFKPKVVRESKNLYKVQLEVSEVALDLSGSYQVNCRNELGESSAKLSVNFDQEQPASRKGSASQSEASWKPAFLDKPTIKQTGELKHIQFDCRLRADPRPSIQWLHQGKPLNLVALCRKLEANLEPDRERGEHHYVASLLLKAAETEQAGEYKCVASNRHGSSQATITLNITQAKGRQVDGRAPRFPLKPLIRQKGQLLSIDCLVEGSPKPSFTWHHQESRIEAESAGSRCRWHWRGPITSESELRALGLTEQLDASGSASGSGSGPSRREFYLVSLEIRQPRASDGGTYRCSASNELGESSANISLNFQQQERNEQVREEFEEKKEQEEEEEEEKEELERRRTKLRKESSAARREELRQEMEEEERRIESRESQRRARLLAAERQEEAMQVDEAQSAGKRISSLEGSAGSERRSIEAKTGRKSATLEQLELQQAEAGEATSSTSAASTREGRRQRTNQAEEAEAKDELAQLAPVKRTSSTSSSSGAPRRLVSVKKKRASLLGAELAEEESGGGSGGPEAPQRKVSVKRRVSVKKRDSAGSVASEVGAELAGERARIPSVSIEAPSSLLKQQELLSASQANSTSNTSQQHQRRPSGSRKAAQPAGSSQRGPRLSVSDTSSEQPEAEAEVDLPVSGAATGVSGSRRDRLHQAPKIDEPANESKRGTYDGLRAEPAAEEDSEAEEEKRRYLATRGGAAAAPRESLSPQHRQQGPTILLDPRAGSPTPGGGSSAPGSAGSSRQGSAEPSSRRGSILLIPDGDQRRPSIILPDDNKLRPGEIADMRRRSSIDVRRASAIEVEAADRPSTPLRACGKKPAILDFQDNISGTENHTSYLTFGIEGDPVPTLRFFKGDSEIYEGGRYSMVTDGETNTVHFCIRKSKPMDEARYKVCASNEHGEDVAYMQLFVSDESGMDFRAMLKHRQYAKWKKDQDDPNWGNLRSVEEERLAQIKEPKRPDNFLKPLQNQHVKQGRDSKVRFECVFSKSGVKAKWFRNNKEIFPNKKFHLNSTGDLHVLEIHDPFVEDAGKFTCQCLDTKCSAMLEVDEPDPVYKFTKLLAKGYGQHLNRELVLECSCNSHRAKVEWFKDDPDCKGTPLINDGGSSSAKYVMEMDKFGKKVLRVKNCQFEDSGQYTCKIMNTPKSDEITNTQVVISEKKFQFKKPLYSQRATEDDKIVLECEVDEPDAPVKWYRKDRETGKWKELKAEQMKHKEIVVDGRKRRLVIKKGRCQDEGEYKCCTNADETACELFVEPSNKWRKKLTDVTIVEGEPLVLEVELMEKKPGVALLWNKNGKQIGCQGGASMSTTADERIQFKTVEDKLQLVIEQAKPSDAGDWSVLFNRMKCACKVTVLPMEKAPTMRFPDSGFAAEVGKPLTVEIPYQVLGTKQSAVQAKLLCNGQPVAKDKVELVVKDDKIVMKFKDPQRADANENYEFVLENAKGKQAQKFKLDVQGPPGPPEGPLKVSEIYKDRCKLQWMRPLDDGGSPVAHYVVERQEVGTGRTSWQECGITSTCELDVQDLIPKKEYKFRVRAVNKKGKSEPLVSTKTVLAKDPFDPPSEPENLVVVNWDKDFVDLEWEAPTKDGGIPVEKYIVESKSKFSNEWVPVMEQKADAGCKAHITENLKEGAQLQFRVKAVNRMGPGEPSKATKPVIIKARFVRPYINGDGLKNIVVKKGRPIRFEINFNGEPPPEICWIANDQELRSITDKCEIDKAEKKTILQVTNTTRADSGRYKLILKNSCGQVVSEADVVVLDRPSAPEGPLVVEEIKSDQVTIKWRKPKDSGGQDLEGYVVEKMNLETGRWVPAGECGAKEEMFTVKNLMKGKKYKFRVRAKNKDGESDALETSNVLNVGEEPSIQKCPSKVQIGQGETAKIKIHFQGDPTEFRVINMDNGLEIGEAGELSGSGQPKYTVFDDYLTVTIPDAQKGKHSGRYKVELKNKIGICEANFDLDVSGPPGAPGGPLEVSDVTENSAQLSWRPPSDDGGNRVSHYVVERRDTSQGEDAWIEVSNNCTGTAFNVNGLAKDQSYEFRVMAVNENGQSKPLVCDHPVVAKLPYDPPGAPGKPEAKAASEDSIQLEWTKPSSDGGSRVTGYYVEKREMGTDTWQKVNQAGQPILGTECLVKNLIEDRKYEFRVIAQNAAGLSEPSECSASIQVKDPNATDVPKFVQHLKKKVCAEGGSFELECIVQGQPAPTVVWSKGGKDLRDTAGAGKYCMTQESGPDGTTIFRLLVTRASADDQDEYSIKAINKAGSRTSRCDVEIQTKPKIHVPPRLSGEAPIAFDRGESIQLKVPFTGNPAPEVHWYKGDEEIEPSAQFDIESDGRHTILTIRDATREDSGEYRLVVSNKLGQDSATFQVSVSDRPEPPRFPGVESVIADAAQLSWKAPLWDGGSQITQYVIEKRELPMTSWIRAATTRFLSHQVINLNEEKDYEFRIFAENIYGRSEASDIVRCTTKQSGREKKGTVWPLDKDGHKIRSQLPEGSELPDDYDRFVKDQPACHLAADIKTCPITDNYEILERIGEGIFGEVYRVRERATGDYYAAKFTPTSSNEEKSLLKKEIDTVNLLHHKNILRLHDAYEDQDEMVTVHEFISGPEVYEKICEPGYQMTEEQVRKYMRDICEAVRHMHDRNVIHLDLKPENLVLQSNKPLSADHEPKVKIVDFGLACKLDPHEICKISTSAADYAAPEILEKDSVGFYTDMWAIGVLTYTLMSGHTPFDSQADIKAGQWQFDDPVFDKVSQEGKDFIEKLLVRQKEKRMTAHECLEHPWLREDGDEETRKKRRQPLVDGTAFRKERDAMKRRYLDWWDKSLVPIGHISNYGPLRKLNADRYKIHDALLDRRELAPRFVIKPQSTFAYEGQSAKFYCLISSDSPIIVTWFKDNHELKQSVKYMKRYTIDNNFNFIVNRCKMGDFGEYVIRAENHHGGREEPVFLDVRKRPVDFTPVHLEPMRKRREPEPPKFEEEPDCAPKFNFLLRPRIIQSGLGLKLICCLKGKPAPTITWLKDGKELSKRDYSMKNSDGVISLEIAACDTSHTGKYTCLAQNSLGEDKTVADVLIEGKRTFTPTPMAGYLATGTTPSWQFYTGRHQRSASLTRAQSPPPSTSGSGSHGVHFAARTLSRKATDSSRISRSDSISGPSMGSGNQTATLYSANFSMNTNRYLRRSHKVTSSGYSAGLPTGLPSRSPSRFGSRLPRIPYGSRNPLRSLSSFGRSSSSLQ